MSDAAKKVVSKVANMGSGKGTYVTGGALILLGIATALGYAEIPEDVRTGLMSALGGAAALFLRRATGKAAEAASK